MGTSEPGDSSSVESEVAKASSLVVHDVPKASSKKAKSKSVLPGNDQTVYFFVVVGAVGFLAIAWFICSLKRLNNLVETLSRQNRLQEIPDDPEPEDLL